MMKKITAFLEAVLYCSIVLIPFFMGIAPAPMNAFMGVAIFTFILKSAIKKEKVFAATGLNAALAAFFLATCLSALNSLYLADTLKGGILRLLQFYFIFFILAREIKDQAHARRIILSVALGLAVVCLDEIWQVFTARDFIRGYAPVINIGLVRATASFKDSNTLGVYLSALAPLVLGLGLFYCRGRKKIFMGAVSLLAVVGILLTYSRPTLLALYISFWIFALAKKHKPLIAALVIITAIAPVIVPRPVKQWAKDVEYNPARFMCNDDRIAIYENSLNMIKAHPLIGLGANTYMKNYRFYKNSPEYRGVVTSDYIYAHNNFLHLLAELGFLGLGIFLWLLYLIFRQSLRIRSRLAEPFLKTLSLSLIVGLTAFLINGLTESSLYSSRVAGIFWFLAGFSLGLKKFIHADS
jgi:O-antigen ligase